jgi:PAS domain S-box-containing protein
METKSLLNRKMQLAFGSAMLTLFVVGAISYRGMFVSSESARWVGHSHQVLESIQDLVFGVESIESNSRGFALTGKESYLDSYRAGLLKVAQDQASIRFLTLDNAAQQRQIPALENLTAQKIERAEMIIRMRQSEGPQADAIRSGSGQGTMDSFLAAVGRVQGEELRLLVLRNADTKLRLRQNKMVVIFGTLLGLFIAGAAGWSTQRDNSARGRAEGAFRDSEEKYRMLLDGVQDYAIFLLDPRGRVVNWNAGAERIKGYTADEIIGHDFSCFFPPEGIKRGRPEEVLRLTATNGYYAENSMRVRKDGTQFLASLTFTALRDADGSLRGFSEVSRDLSESQESEARYRGLLEAAPDAMVVVNQDGKIVLLNVQAEKQFGYRRDELIGQKVKNIIPEGFAERLIADGTRSAADALAQQIGTGIELNGRRKDGTEFPIEIMLSPLEGAEGILVTAAIRNISVRKAAEEHLAQMEGRYRGLLEAAPDAMVVVNQSGEIVLLNVQAEKQFGFHRDELVGQKVKNIIPKGFAERLIADGTRSAAEALAQQIGTGIELNGRRKDGSEFPIEIMLSPLEGAEGILVTAAIRDISVRKAAEEHLAQMERRYRGLLEAAPDGMVVVNQNGEIVLLNVQAEKQFAYRRDELIGQKVKNIIPEGFAERLIADARRSTEDALAQQIGTGIELNGRRKDGSEFPIEIMLSPLKSAEGILVTAAIRDITDRAKMRHHVEALQKFEAIGRLAGGIGHDFNNALGVILGWANLGQEEAPPGSRLGEMFDKIASQAKHAAGLTFQLLAFARRQVLQPQNLNLNGLVSEVARLLSAAMGDRIEFKIVCAADLRTVHADQTQIEQVLMNLCLNARDAMAQGGRLVVETQNVVVGEEFRSTHSYAIPGEYVLLSVADTGLGMDKATLDHIFEPFFSTKEIGKGTGLGLATVYGIVRQHGGFVNVYSELGHGTSFRVYLPRVAELPYEARPIDAEQSVAGTETALIGEDHEELREIASEILTAHGYHVILAKNGEDAVRQFKAHVDEIDVIILDVMMPRLPGPAAYAQMCAIKPGVPVIFTSGYSAVPALLSASLESGAGFLQKPYPAKALGRAVRNALDRTHSLRG